MPIYKKGGASGVDLGVDVKLNTFGKHLSSQVTGETTSRLVYNATSVIDETGTIETFYIDYSAEEERIVTHGNAGDLSGPSQNGAAPEVIGTFVTEWTGTAYEYNVTPIQGYIIKKIYYKTGSVAATEPVRVTAYRGSDHNGAKFYDKILPASNFPANSEVSIDLPNAEYAEGEELHWMLESTASFSLITNVGNVSPWRAVDRMKTTRQQIAPYGILFKKLNVTTPASGATGVSLTPTITTVKQSAKDRIMCLKTASTNGIGANTDITWGNVKGTLTYSSPYVTLKAGIEYNLTAGLGLNHSAVGSDVRYGFVNTANTLLPDSSEGHLVAVNNGNGYSFEGTAVATYTPSVDTQVKLRLTMVSGGTVDVRADGTWMFIEEATTRKLDYAQDQTQVQIKRVSDQTLVYQSAATSGLTVNVPGATLTNATVYQVRARHKTLDELWLPWSDWQNFTTV